MNRPFRRAGRREFSRLIMRPRRGPGGGVCGAFLAAVVLGMIAAGVRWGPATCARAALLYHQRRCARYAAPPDQVVFDTDPVRVAALANDPNFTVVSGCAYRRPPAEWAALSAALPKSWFPPPHAVLFLHQMKVPGGKPRIVALERVAGCADSALFFDGYDVETHVIDPATATRPLNQRGPNLDVSVLDGVGPHTDIRIFAGQSDSADASHFTVAYESGGRSHIVDGTLDASDLVNLKRRHEPSDEPEQAR